MSTKFSNVTKKASRVAKNMHETGKHYVLVIYRELGLDQPITFTGDKVTLMEKAKAYAVKGFKWAIMLTAAAPAYLAGMFMGAIRSASNRNYRCFVEGKDLKVVDTNDKQLALPFDEEPKKETKKEEKKEQTKK